MEKTTDEKASERLAALQHDIACMADVCSSGGVVNDLPGRMTEGFSNFGIGLIVCHEGEFEFTLSGRTHKACRGETVFIPEGAFFSVERKSETLRLSVIVYKTAPIRYLVGTMVQSVQLYARLSPDLPCVWSTGCEDDIAGYISLIGSGEPQADDLFAVSERKMLLLSLTYRLCMVFSRKYFADGSHNARRTEVFLKLIQLIGRHYMAERGVAFYADKELVFKAITRKAMSLLDSTGKTVAEIADDFHFPNPSSFGTFFRKQTGMSPQKYRERM